MNKYVIFAETGAYSDYRAKPVGVYDDRAEAEKIAAELEAQSRAWHARLDTYKQEQWKLDPGFAADPKLKKAYRDEFNRSWDKWHEANPPPKHDPFGEYHGFTTYTVVAVPSNSCFVQVEKL